MIDELAAIAASCDLTIPKADRRPLAIVGAGGIADVAHLPAWRRAGLDVVAIHDTDPARARDLAARHGIPAVHDTLASLLATPADTIIDIAVPAEHQPRIAIAAMEAGHDVMCQKPLGVDLSAARSIVAAADRLGRTAAVQQQLRFEEGIAAAREMVRRGWIGTPTAVGFDVDILSDFTAWGWLVGADQLDLRYHSIHYLDAVRAFVGDPLTVFGTTSRRPGQTPRGETRSISTLVYPGELRALVNVNHENITGRNRAEFRIDGTDGAIRGTLGLDYDYPHGRPDTLEVWSRVLPTDGWLPYPVTTRWIPDAFVGPMRSLLASLAGRGWPETDVHENLGTIALVDALYRSAATGEAQAIAIGREAS